MSFSTKDHTKEVLTALQKAKHKGLTAIGLQAEGYAKEIITAAGAVDTGRLRNSITFAIAGYKAHIKRYKADKPDAGGKNKAGQYEGEAEGKKDSAVYIGTNVEYAAGIELGTHRKAGAVHFLQGAASNHTAEYKELLINALKNAD